MRTHTFYKHHMTGAELDVAVQTIEWPYGVGERFTGNVADASAHIIRNSDAEGGAYILIKREDYGNFYTLNLYEESEDECYSGGDYPYRAAARIDHRFIGRIYCANTPA